MNSVFSQKTTFLSQRYFSLATISRNNILAYFSILPNRPEWLWQLTRANVNVSTKATAKTYL